MDQEAIFLLTELLVILACTLYVLDVVRRVLVEAWYAFCALANAIDRRLMALGARLTLWFDGRSHKREAKRAAIRVPAPRLEPGQRIEVLTLPDGMTALWVPAVVDSIVSGLPNRDGTFWYATVAYPHKPGFVGQNNLVKLYPADYGQRWRLPA